MYMFRIMFLFLGIPSAAIVFFIVSLCLYCSAKRKSRRQLTGVGARRMKTYKIMLIVSSVIVGVLLSVVLGFIALISMGVAFM